MDWLDGYTRPAAVRHFGKPQATAERLKNNGHMEIVKPLGQAPRTGLGAH